VFQFNIRCQRATDNIVPEVSVNRNASWKICVVKNNGMICQELFMETENKLKNNRKRKTRSGAGTSGSRQLGFGKF